MAHLIDGEEFGEMSIADRTDLHRPMRETHPRTRNQLRRFGTWFRVA